MLHAAMAGHESGIVAVGATLRDAAERVLSGLFVDGNGERYVKAPKVKVVDSVVADQLPSPK